MRLYPCVVHVFHMLGLEKLVVIAMDLCCRALVPFS
jgi:hypothetical protein